MKVLLTRPFEDSKIIAMKLKKKKIISQISPLIEIKSVCYSKKIYLKKFDLLIFTSKNGLRFFEGKKFLNNLVFAVGDGTYNEAKKLGYKKIENSDGNILDLINLITKKFQRKKIDVLHPTTNFTRKELRSYFIKNNCNYFSLPVYCSEKIKKNKTIIKKFLIENSGIVTLFSPKTASCFLEIISELSLEKYCANQVLITLSSSINKEVENLNFKKVLFTNKPNQESLLKIINNL